MATSQADAEAAAVEAAEGEVLASELEGEDGYAVWEVTVRAPDGSIEEVHVNAADASVLGTERDDDGAEDQALAEVATSQADAEAAAVEAAEGEVLASELEAEDGYAVWEVTVRAPDGSLREVHVNAADATILGTGFDD